MAIKKLWLVKAAFMLAVFADSGMAEDTSLHQAAQNGHSAIAKLLLDAGTYPNIQDEFGNTPLHDAVLWGHENVAKLLLNAGANLDIRNDGGTVPLHNAARWGRDAVAKRLLEHG